MNVIKKLYDGDLTDVIDEIDKIKDRKKEKEAQRKAEQDNVEYMFY